MIIVKLQGGLGNQMFQYAFGRCLSIRHNTELKFDLSHLKERANIGDRVIRDFDLDIFNIQGTFANEQEAEKFTKRTGIANADKVLRKLFGPKAGHIFETDLHFNQAYFNAPANAYLEGYFASPKYFEPVRDVIEKEFTVKEPLTAKAQEMMEEINQSNAVCVNIRRGDFVTNPTHNICGIDYYLAAQERLLNLQPDSRFFVFSDEVEWCKDNLNFSAPTTFVTHDYKGRKFQDYFRLMSACQHFIIPNSTFAWWAAYLNKAADKIVIVPSRWLNLPNYSVKDILPDSWIKVNA